MHTPSLADKAKNYACSIVPPPPVGTAQDTNVFFENLARIMIAGVAAYHRMEVVKIRESLSTPNADFQKFCLSVGRMTAGYDAASAEVIRPLTSLGKLDYLAFCCTHNAAWYLFSKAQSSKL